MAITVCRECKAEVSDRADSCPKCGVKSPGRRGLRKSTGCILAIGVVALLGVVGVIGSSSSQKAAGSASSPSSATATGDGSSDPTATPSQLNAAPTSKWTYTESSDEMRGTKSHSASLVSDNELDFKFPYSGGSSATLTLRKGATHGLNVILRMEKGQFLCNEYNHPTISVKFDKGPIKRFGCSESSDNSTGVLFIDSESKFVAGLKRSKTLTIEAEFFQEGARQLNFTTSGLNWNG